MKKIICLILALLMMLSFTACTDIFKPSPDDSEENGTNASMPDETEEDVEDTTTEAPTTEEPTTEGATTEDPFADKESAPKYNGVFQTGYAREVITPSVPIGQFEEVMNDLYATCVAVYDGEKTILLVSIDIGSIMEDKCDSIRNKIKSATKIPTDNIFISATHNHSSIHFGVSSVWDFNAYNKIANAAKNAIADLSDTEMFIGTAKTTGMAFVRRYVDANGNYATVNPGTYDTVELDPATTKCVGEADDTLQVVRFVREGKTDIVAANWQAHLAHAVNEYPKAFSADLAHYMRTDVEARDDVKVIYFAGASGNINLTPPNDAARKYQDHIEVGRALASLTLEAIKEENLTPIEAGKIEITKETYNAKYAKNTPEEIAAAKDRLSRGEGGTLSLKVDEMIVARTKATSADLRLASLSIGDLALITVPYEMFDTNGMQIKEESPFKMTLILTNSDGAWIYMPSYKAATEYGGYDAQYTYFEVGTAEKLVAEYLRMLKEFREAD